MGEEGEEGEGEMGSWRVVPTCSLMPLRRTSSVIEGACYASPPDGFRVSREGIVQCSPKVFRRCYLHGECTG